MRIALGAATVGLTVLVGACDMVPTTAERRAQEFVELELQAPGAETVIEGVATGVALEYLRARVRQDATPEITPVATQKPAPGERVVLVDVSVGPGRAAKEDRVQFRVQLVRDAELGWRVRGLRAE